METIKNDVIERVTTISGVLRELGEEDQDVIDYKKLITVFDGSHHLVNYMLAILIVKALNEKREPNWDDEDEYKYQLWFWMGGSSGFRYYVFVFWHSASYVGSRLCFMESRLGEHAVAQPEFLKVFENFMLIKK